MNNKAQMAGVGALVVVFVAVVVGLALYSGGIAPSVGESTQTAVQTWTQLTGGDGNTRTLVGQAASNFTAINESTGDVIPATNYTINNYVVLSTGSLGSTVQFHKGNLAQGKVNVSYTYEPLGYVADSGSRSMVSLIAVFAALAIAAAAIAPSIKEAIDNFS